MDPDKYQQAWQADSNRTRVTIDAALLSEEARRSHEEFRSMIFWRDFREVAVGLSMLPVWFVMGAALSLPWTWYLTVPALIWVVGFFLIDRRRHPQRPSEPGEPLLYYVKESLAQVEHQIWLLRNVFWWYLLPFSVSLLAFFLHVAWRTSGVWWVFVVAALLSVLFLVVIYGWVYRLNQRAVRAQLEPRRRDLLKLVASLEGESAGDDLQEIPDLVSALADPVPNCGLSSGWAENWDRLVPSWRVAAAIALATLGGALCGLWFPIPGMGVFFPSVAAAVVAFEIALGCAWLRSRKRQDGPTADREPERGDAGVDREGSANRNPRRLPGAPAILVIGLTLFVSIMAVVALSRFMSDARRLTDDALPGVGLDDVSAFDEDDVARMRWNARPANRSTAKLLSRHHRPGKRSIYGVSALGGMRR